MAQQRAHAQGQRHGEQRQPEAPPVPARAVEADDEAQQVEAQRQDPEERDHRDVLAKRVRRRQQQHHRAGREQEPEPPSARRRGWRRIPGGRRGRGGFGLRGAPDPRAAPDREQHESDQSPRPCGRLLLAGEVGFDQERVSQQRQERPDVRERVEAVGRDAGMRSAEPSLQERTRRGEHQVGQAEAAEQEAEDVGRRRFLAGGLPGFGRGDGQQAERQQEQSEVDRDLCLGTEPADAEMRVRVAAEQQDLEEQHARRPDRGTAAEPRQDEARDEGLDEEEQERPPEDGQAVGEHIRRAGPRGRG